jgi:endo-1,3(4)-beta-glucanase
MVLPTNAWFEGFMVGTGNRVVYSIPYHLQSYDTGLDVCIANLDTTSYTTAIIATQAANISLRATAGSATTRKVTAFTDLGCTITYGFTGGSMVADVIRGAAFTSMRYSTLTPSIFTTHAFTSINGTAVDTSSVGSFTGTKFKLTLNNGQTWIIYTTSTITLTQAAGVLNASAPFTGTVRVAILPTGALESALDSAAPAIHTGGTVDMSISGSNYVKTLNYTMTGTGTLLTYAMPHHQTVLSTPSYPSGFTLTGLRGVLKAVSGNAWTLTYAITMPGFYNKNPIRADRVAAVQAALDADQGYIPTAYPYGINDTIADPYFGGKKFAKSAHLALIADQLGDTVARDQLLGNLKTVMNRYLLGNDTGTKLRYETQWGGVVSEAGLTDSGRDFGNGVFNDHYFHYGYMIYAASVIAKFDSAWLTTYKSRINDLCRDIANPATGNADPYFTPLRHFDQFEGHSWASGILEDSQANQESTSEGVNAWYGLYLWGISSNQPLVSDLGKALFTEETKTAQTYWQIKQSSTVYPSPFKQWGCIGILWSFKVTHETWFDNFPAQSEHVYGIQFLPITPASEVLLDKAWLTELWPAKIEALFSRTSPAVVSDEWKSVLLGGRALISADDAWTRIQALSAVDDGTSKTQLLYMAATQN